MSTYRLGVLAGGRRVLHGKVLAHASNRVLLAMAAAKDGELRHFDAEQAFLKADIDEEIYIEISEEFQEFPGAVGQLNKAIYGLVQVGRCWNNKFCDDMTAIGFEQAKVDLCVFRKVVDGEAVRVVVVHVDGILAHAKDQATMDRFAAELGQKFKLKDMGRRRVLHGLSHHKKPQGARVEVRPALVRGVNSEKV